MMTKKEAVESIYGENPSTFYFDSALPAQFVDYVVDKLMATFPTDDRSEYYGKIVRGTVFAYCRNTNRQGFLPFTMDSLRLLCEYERQTQTTITFHPVAL